jgi:hypothetical protein
VEERLDELLHPALIVLPLVASRWRRGGIVSLGLSMMPFLESQVPLRAKMQKSQRYRGTARFGENNRWAKFRVISIAQPRSEMTKTVKLPQALAQGGQGFIRVFR